MIDGVDEFGDDWDEDTLNSLALSEASCSKENTEPNSEPHQVNNSQAVDDVPGEEHISALKKIFGHQQFRPMQWKIINSILNDKRDNCAVMSTGYGKSLCFQYPSAFTGGVTFVISPLISLMEDQVLSLTVANIPACLLGSANTKKATTFTEISENKYRIVYMTPEFVAGELGIDLIKEWSKVLNINLLAIDEAHCVSSWGHDFRVKYRSLGKLRDILPSVPILAVTATATDKVIKDVSQSLKLRNPQFTRTSFDRPNFYFAINKKGAMPHEDFKTVMEHHDGNWKFSGPTIIYCITRNTTEKISAILLNMGINCAAYHAGLSLKERKEIHEKFVRDLIDVVVATIAFGMGIDKPDIRNVIHYGVSDSIEGYYQEVGRAGRDGQPAKCITFYDETDFKSQAFLRSQITNLSNRDRKEVMIGIVRDFLGTNECRRKFILNYFGEQIDTSKLKTCCDNCRKGGVQKKNYSRYEDLDADGNFNFSTDTRLLLTVIENMNCAFGLASYIGVLRGSQQAKLKRYSNLPIFGAGKSKPDIWWKELAELLLREKFLRKCSSKTNRFVSLTVITDAGREFLKTSRNDLLLHPTPPMFPFLKIRGDIWSNEKVATKTENKESIRTTLVSEIDSLDREEHYGELYRLLINKRSQLAKESDIMPYMIASNKVLLDIAKLKPTNLKHLEQMQLEGFTEVKLKRFGKHFIDVVLDNTGNKDVLSIKCNLEKFPLENVNMSQTINVTYALFQSGKSIEDIAKERGVAASTVATHLTTCQRLGFEVELCKFGIDKNVAETIINAIIEINSDLKKLSSIKNCCPPEITYGQIRAVVSYLEIRKHLLQNQLRYTEFDKPEYFEMYMSRLEKRYDKLNMKSQLDDDLEEFIQGLKEVEDKIGSNTTLENNKLETLTERIESDYSCNNSSKGSPPSVNNTSKYEPDAKKSKTDAYSLLDSPPPLERDVFKGESVQCTNFYSSLDSPPRC